MTDHQLSDELDRYLFDQGQLRYDRVVKTLEALTLDQRKLIKEAAVMGYVLGKQAAQAPVPQDWVILWDVVSSCLDLPDLYPTFNEVRPAVGDDQ